MPARSDPPRQPDAGASPAGSTLGDALQARQGDSQAWWRLDERIRPWLQARLARLRRPPGIELDDLVQEVLLEMLQSLPRFAPMPGASFRGWVLHLARVRLANLWRGARRLKRGGGRALLEGSTAEQAFGGLPDRREAAQSALARCRELSDRVAAAIARLPDKHRAALELRWTQELPFDEIARRLGYNRESTARSLCFRARERLQEALGPLLAPP
jgi:RNA polymerase sigma-70 factor (ECF subfamily)